MLAAQISVYDLKEEQLEEYYGYIKKCGMDIMLISCCEFYCEGEERAKILGDMKRAIDYFESKGTEVFVWTSSLGYGGPRGKEFHSIFPSFTPLTDFEGGTQDVVCTLDRAHTEYMKRNVRDFIKAGAKTILWDDDLVQSVRPGLVCCCPEHLKKFYEKTGKSLTPAGCKKLFTGAPSADRNAYLAVMSESLNGFCREMRNAADETDPTVNMGLCASFTHYDIDVEDMAQTVDILKGKGCAPLLRFSGAPYWASFAPKYNGHELAGVIEFVKFQYGLYSHRGIRLMDENDCYPRDDRIVPASYVELYDKIMLTMPELIRHKYILCFSHDSGTRRYMNEHIRNIADDKKILSLTSGLEPCGLRVYRKEHILKDAVLPEEYPGNGKMFAKFSQPFEGIFAVLNSVPTKYQGKGAGIVFGDSAKQLSEEELSQGLILDMPAAMLIKERGTDTGFITAEKAPSPPSSEKFGNKAEAFYEPDGIFYKARLNENARVLSTFEADGEIFPACWLYEDENGKKFAVYAFDGYTLTYGKSGGTAGAVYSVQRQKQLAEIFGYLSGGTLPIYIEGQAGLYIQALSSADGNEKAFVLCNISPDRLPQVSPEIYGGYELCGQLNEGQFEMLDGRLQCNGIPPFSYTAFRIKKGRNSRNGSS